MKNLILVIGIVITAAAGVYIYTQRDSAQLVFEGGAVSDDVLMRTRAFIDHRRVLEEVSLTTTVLTDGRLSALRSFTQPITERPAGRINPFAAPVIVSGSGATQ